MAFLGTLAGCGKNKEVHKSERYGEMEVSAGNENWDLVETDTVVLQNNRIKFVMDVSNTHFIVEDSVYHTRYQSAVTETLPNAQMELSEKAQSELFIYYYDENSQKQEMNSYQHSVAFGNYKVFTNQEAVRVYYTLQLKETPPFVPSFLNEEMYQSITSQLDSTTMFKMKLMYKFYDVDNTTTDAKEIREKYPYAKEHAVYVLNSNISESDREVLNRYMEEASYTQEQYYKELKEMNIELDEETPMQFTVPVQYTLTENGIEVSILSDKITAANSEYVLQSISILPYFNCGVVTDEDGFMLLPDGSGSVMKLNKADNAGYSQKLYGSDNACENQLTSVNSKNAVMPLLGYSSKQGSWMCYIDGSTEMAKMNAYRAGNTEYCAHGYSEFELYSTDSFTMRKSTVPLAVFTKEMSIEQPRVQYIFLQQQAEIMDMADWYRSYLIESGKLTGNDTIEDMNLYLEFTGYITQKTSFLGVSYDEKIVLSTLSDIKGAVEQLIEAGISNIYIRLIGYGENGGKYHGLEDGFSLEPEVGSMEELEQLAQLLLKNGGGLFLEDDFFVVYKDTMFDSFSSTSDSVRRLDKTLADIRNSDLVTGEIEEGTHVRYLVSPKLYEGLAEDFRSELKKNVKTEGIHVSIADAGKYLVSDFNIEDEFDRIQTRNALQSTMKLLKGKQSLMSDVGNEYVLPYTEHILNMAFSDSNYSAEDFSVPFYQLVLHGNMQFAGEAMNLAKNQEKLKFDTLLTGASPFYSCVTNKLALESLESDQNLYPTAFEVVYEDIISMYTEHQEMYVERAEKKVSNFEILQDGLYLIEYDHTLSMIFNGNSHAVNWNGQEIKAENYIIVRK